MDTTPKMMMTSKMRGTSNMETTPKNDDDLKNEDNLKNEGDLKKKNIIIFLFILSYFRQHSDYCRRAAIFIVDYF